QNMLNGKKYVGQTVRPLETRFNEHTRQNTFIGRAIRKYGKENFRYGVIKSCASKSEMDYWEKFFIAALKTKSPKGYNLTDGGTGFTEEVRAKMSAKQKGVSRSLQHCANISAGQRGNSPFKNLTAEIDKMKLTYTSLAKLLGLTQQTVSRKMLGQENFTEKDKVKLAEIFNLPAEYLMERTDGLPARISKLGMKIFVSRRCNSPLKNLLNEMKKRKINGRGLGKLMGMGNTSIRLRINGKIKFKANEIEKLVEIFNLPAEYLLQETD
ncbi:MAG: helix-turn-helix domain-containing protein, partial [Selenomonadaceae bacterium]|nr:helix-turn-helix domain-containing protein [Selenomonadaceae bacterium]